jgi:hypothetical protein
MLSRKIIKRGLTGALVCAAAGFPAGAQASFTLAGGGGGNPNPPVPVASGQAVQQGGAGFQWGDAGIGAAAAITVLGAGVASSGAARRRRAQRSALV